MKLREFAGAVNRAREVVVPVYFHKNNEDAVAWISVAKREVKDEILSAAKELGLEEVHAFEEDGILYIDPDAEGIEDVSGPQEEEEEEEEEEGAEEEEEEEEEKEEPATQ